MPPPLLQIGAHTWVSPAHIVRLHVALPNKRVTITLSSGEQCLVEEPFATRLFAALRIPDPRSPADGDA